MEKRTPLVFIGDSSKMVSERIHDFVIKRRMKKVDKWKPGILASMREQVENKCQMEYNEEIERLNDDIYEKQHIINEVSRSSSKYKAKYEEYKELYEKLLEKHEQKAEKLGETKEKLNATEADLKEILDENTPLNENADFSRELKALIGRCNNEKYNKAESMSSFSAKWNVSLKEVLDEENKIIDFKYKEIQQ